MSKIICALPRGRVGREALPILKSIGVEVSNSFYNDDIRSLKFSTSAENIDVIKVRSFDVAKFVAIGAAHFGIVGYDVIIEFSKYQIYAPVNLHIGLCRLSIAGSHNVDFGNLSHISVATKYPNLASQYFAQRNIQAECIKLNGSIELATTISDVIVDLVSTGNTLAENSLIEIAKIMDISSYLIMNPVFLKTNSQYANQLIKDFENNV